MKDESSATFLYRIDKRRHIVFDAGCPARRQSFSALNPNKQAPRVRKFEHFQSREHRPLDPVLPIRRSKERDGWSDAPRVNWSSARSVFADRRGDYHIFHDFLPKRRMSWDGVRRIDFIEDEPHRARQALWVPLKKLEEAEAAERRRGRWFAWKLPKVQRSAKGALTRQALDDRWHRFCGRVGEGRATPHHEYGEPVWLPHDVADQTLFCMRPRPHRRRLSSESSRSFARSDSPAAIAPRTSDDVSAIDRVSDTNIRPGSPSAYNARRSLVYGGYTHGGSAPSVLVHTQDRADDRSAFPAGISERNGSSVAELWESDDTIYIQSGRSPRPPSWTDSTSSSTSSTTGTAEEEVPPSKGQIILVYIAGTIMAIFNTLSGVALYFACLRGVRKLKRGQQNLQTERSVKRQGQMDLALARSMPYQCPICDQDFEQERKTRQWHKIRQPSSTRVAEGQKPGFVAVVWRTLDFLGYECTKKVYHSSKRALYHFLERSDILREIGRAILARIAAYELEFADLARASSQEPDSMV